MTPGTLVLVIALIWLAMLVGLWRLLVRMEQTEREVAQLDVQGRPPLGSPRG